MFSVCKDRKLNESIAACNKTIEYKVQEWHNTDPVPIFGSEVGIDTETELITATNKTPPLVVLGVYNPKDNTCYIVPYEDAKLFMRHVLLQDPVIYLANAGFDYYELWSEELQEHCDSGRIIDVLIRAQLQEIADPKVGFQVSYSLKDLCKYHLNYVMNKHEEEGEASVRLNFRRNTEVSEEQLKYLSIDCITTYLAGHTIPAQPTEVVDTWGGIVLTHVSSNGLAVDMRVFQYFENKLLEEKEKYRQQLIGYGFPDPDKHKLKKASYIQQVVNSWYEWQAAWLERTLPNETYKIPTEAPGKVESIRLILYTAYIMEHGNSPQEVARYYATIRSQGAKALNKGEKKAFDSLLEQYDFLGPITICNKKGVWACLVRAVIEGHINGEEAAFNAVDQLIQEHTEWFTKDDAPGPVEFLQNHLTGLTEANPKLGLAKTKTGRLKCSKKDIWKLEDAGIQDPFLESYTNYSHVAKYLSTYLDRKYIAEDGKVRTRFSQVTTMRTSSNYPNIQNLPSHDSVYSLKYMYVPPPGTIFCSVDYSFNAEPSWSNPCRIRK